MKKHLFPLAVGLLTLTACTSEEVVDVSQSQSNVIGFENVVNKNTRVVEGDLTGSTFDNFLVYGYYTKERMSTPIQIFNGVPVTKDKATGNWSYSGVRYWVPECSYYFYAYSCADIELVSENGNPAMTLTNETTEDGRALTMMSYLCDGRHQHDLVCAESGKIVAQEKNNEKVGLNFTHALCKMKAVFTTDFPDGYEVKVSNVKVTGFFNRANYNVGSGAWSDYKLDGTKPSTPFFIDDKNNVVTNASGSKVETSEIFVIPKLYAHNTEFVTLHFTIEISKDGETILERAITGTWSPQWESSRIYKYNINISGSSAGIEPIIFAASQSLTGSTTWDTSNEVTMVFGVDTAATVNE